MATENALYTIVLEKIKQDALVLPTLPEIALKVREAADDPDVNLHQMSDIIGHDAALSIGMLKVANSAMLGRSVRVETVNQAVTRIGLRQIKSIATAMALEQVFVSKNEVVTMYMNRTWQKTIDVSSVAIALMVEYLKENKHSPLMLDTLTLAALVHNIGVLPVLTEAENHPEVFADSKFLQQAIAKLSNSVGVAVIEAWGFSDEFSTIVENWSNLALLPKEPNYLDFIRVGAIYHGIFKSEATQAALIKSYVSKGVLPDEDYIHTAEFESLVADVKAMLT